MEKQSAVRVSRLSTFAFGLRRDAQTSADGTFCGGPFWGLQSIKFLDASQFRLCLLYGNGVGRSGYRALQRVPSVFFCAKKDCCTWVLPSIAVLFMYIISRSSHLPVSRKLARRATVSVENQRGNFRFPLRTSHEKVEQPSLQA